MAGKAQDLFRKQQIPQCSESRMRAVGGGNIGKKLNLRQLKKTLKPE